MNNIFDAIPTQYIVTKGFKILNFGQTYFFPPATLQNNLKEVIVFTENNKKRDIPNGSVWTYNSTEYDPRILKDDVGCGITGFLTEEINNPKKFATEIMNVLNYTNIDIGKGNHFIDVTQGHPKIDQGSMIFIHSDFNREKNTPRTLNEAKEKTKEAKNKRIETIYEIGKELGIKIKLYKNWTHNSVEKIDDQIIYRKGSINLNETENEGILALNPLEGIYLYIAKFDNYKNSMQHGTGKKTNRKFNYKATQQHLENGKYKAILPQEFNPDIYNEFNDMNKFKDQFFLEQRPLGITKPFIAIQRN